jgi:hypothetical protein
MSNDPTPESNSPETAEMHNKVVRHYNEQRRYLGERIDELTETGATVAGQLDRTLISLSGGALIFSMTFVDKIAPARLAPWLLFAAWCAFGLCMLSVMFSMQSNQRAATKAIENLSTVFSDLDKAEIEAFKTGRLVNVAPGPAIQSKITGVFNVAGMLAFIVGLTMLGLFIVYNIRHAPPPRDVHECRTPA